MASSSANLLRKWIFGRGLREEDHAVFAEGCVRDTMQSGQASRVGWGQQPFDVVKVLEVVSSSKWSVMFFEVAILASCARLLVE